LGIHNTAAGVKAPAAFLRTHDSCFCSVIVAISAFNFCLRATPRLDYARASI
jgi:hypothetical protein